MYINTNTSALNTLSKLNQNQTTGSKTMETLSSGKRINRASDDAAGTAVASRMTTQTRGMDQATRNANDGIAMLQTFEGAMGSQADILQRMRELAVQSANGTYSNADRTNLNSEFTQLMNELARIGESTKFNGNAYIDANSLTTANDVTLQLSDVANDVLTVTLQGTDFATLIADDVSTQAFAQSTIGAIDGALDDLNAKRADLGANMNRLQYTVDNLSNAKVNISDAKSRIEDADMAAAMSELTKSEVLTQSSVAMLGKANQAPQAILKLLQ